MLSFIHEHQGNNSQPTYDFLGNSWQSEYLILMYAGFSNENCTIPAISGNANPAICAAPEGTPLRRFNYLKTPPLASQEPVMDAIRTFTIFHGWVRFNVHARF
jgi:hypothetical protein